MEPDPHPHTPNSTNSSHYQSTHTTSTHIHTPVIFIVQLERKRENYTIHHNDVTQQHHRINTSVNTRAHPKLGFDRGDGQRVGRDGTTRTF